MDINVIVGAVKPDHIKSILSGHLPILIDYDHMCRRPGLEGIRRSALWRLRAALRHRDRVREISFGDCGAMFKEFIRATSYHFPALESLILHSEHDHEPEIPVTFLRGSDRSDLPLRRLELFRVSITSVSGLLLSVTGLTDLTLKITTNPDWSEGEGLFLLACLQGMQSLRNLNLTTRYHPQDLLSKSEHSVPKGTAVSMSALTRFHYIGFATFLNDLMSGLSAPSLRDAHFTLCNKIPLLYLPPVIDDVRQEFLSVSVAFDMECPSFHLLSSTDSGDIDHFKPSPFKLLVDSFPYSIGSLSSTPSTKLAMAEELTLNLPSPDLDVTIWNTDFSLRGYLRQFRSVRVLRVNPFVREVGLWLRQGDGGEAIMPVLEKIELSISYWGGPNEGLRIAAEAQAAFEPCERAGRLVEVYYSARTWTQIRNARPYSCAV
jgi:hypothetical protein